MEQEIKPAARNSARISARQKYRLKE